VIFYEMCKEEETARRAKLRSLFIDARQRVAWRQDIRMEDFPSSIKACFQPLLFPVSFPNRFMLFA
jgi:hypothetical protein